MRVVRFMRAARYNQGEGNGSVAVVGTRHGSFIAWQWLSLSRSDERLQKRVLDLEIRLHKLQDHIGFVADSIRPSRTT